MAARPRRLILDNVLSTLQGVTTGNGYPYSPAVEPVLRSWEDALRRSSLPWVGFAPVKPPPPKGQPTGEWRVTMPIQLVVHARQDTHKLAHEQVDALLDSTLAVLLVDCERGGNAIDTLWRGDDTTDGDDSLYDLEEEGIASGVQLWDIVYERTSALS